MFFAKGGQKPKRQRIAIDESRLAASSQFAATFADVVQNVTENTIEERAHEERQAAKSKRQRTKKREGGILNTRIDGWVKDILEDVIASAGEKKMSRTDALHLVFEFYRANRKKP